MTLNIPNLDRLISHLEGLPEEQFNIEFVCRDTECGTVACIKGHAELLSRWGNAFAEYHSGYSWLGLSSDDGYALFAPTGWREDDGGSARYPLSRAIRTLKHMRSEYMRTGQVVVDWDAPEPVTKAAWSAPRAVEQAKPTLPAEIVRFLRPADHEVVS